MDIHQAMEAVELTNEQIVKAKEYCEFREKAAKAKIALDVLLASKYLKAFRTEKKNVGYDMALLMLLEKEPNLQQYYDDYHTFTAKYKGLEKVLDAMHSKVSFHQSIMKYELENA